MQVRVNSFLLVTITSLFLLVGCSERNSTEPTPTVQLEANGDVAESVAGAVGEQSGGVIDQVGDIFELTSSIQLDKATGDGFLDHREATYDDVTGTWTVILQRERGQVGETPYGYWDRIYTVQFKDTNGQPQKFYITEGDTARSILFEIIEGSGYFKNNHKSHALKEIGGSFVATDTHKDMITVNGTYHRAAVDTLTTRNFRRTSDHVLDLTVTDLVGPRGSRRNLSQKVSGVITGTFHADIVFEGERGYAEKSVDRSIHIVLGGGEADIEVEGNKCPSDVLTGQVK
ncbi:hypothetical protein EH223_19490 [candidate division KSB1 bacterium]|nr:hypothetical protein [candidate division KSB1 bacterium]RQW00130.1 MAG: hypothetical protein EH223_19490 [candidate division KSB1 bacterium]